MSTPGVGNLFINVFTGGLLHFVLQFNVHCPQVRVEFSSAHSRAPCTLLARMLKFDKFSDWSWFCFSLFIFSCFVRFFHYLLRFYRSLSLGKMCPAGAPVLYFLFCLLSSECTGADGRPPVDGEKIGRSSVTSRPFCHYLYRAIISASGDLWLMRQPWSKTRRPSTGVAFTHLCANIPVWVLKLDIHYEKKKVCFEFFFFLQMWTSSEIIILQHIHKPQKSFLPPGSFHPLSSGGHRRGAHAERICPTLVLYLL